jgi:hypothetical protein
MEFRENQNFAGKHYHMLQTASIKAGQILKINVGGVAEGRGRYWWIGGIFGALLALAGGIFTWRMRPKQDSGDSIAEAIAGA